jgi:hypothetical protein
MKLKLTLEKCGITHTAKTRKVYVLAQKNSICDIKYIALCFVAHTNTLQCWYGCNVSTTITGGISHHNTSCRLKSKCHSISCHVDHYCVSKTDMSNWHPQIKKTHKHLLLNFPILIEDYLQYDNQH